MNNPCKMCRFYIEGVTTMVSCSTTAQARTGMFLAEPVIDLDRGECHKHAPFTLSGRWPIVDENESCGDFKPWWTP